MRPPQKPHAQQLPLAALQVQLLPDASATTAAATTAPHTTTTAVLTPASTPATIETTSASAAHAAGPNVTGAAAVSALALGDNE